MRHLALLLCAALLAVGISAPNPKPAHAFGGGSVDVAPTAYAQCDPGDCWIRVRELDVTDRSKVWMREYHTSVGAWSNYTQESFPFVIAGDESENFYRWAVSNVGFLMCYPASSSGTWRTIGVSGLDVDGKRATPGTATRGGSFATAVIEPDGSVQLVTGGTTPSVCTPSQMGSTNIAGGTAWSASVAYMADGIHVWATGRDEAAWQWTSAFNWNSLQGGSIGSPAAVSWDQGSRLDVFVRGLDNALWHRVFDGQHWGPWTTLMGGLASGPGCASWAVNRIDCFVIGTDGASLWHIAWDGNIWAWEGLG